MAKIFGKRITFKYLLVLILAVASFLRLWKLSEVPVSLFGDELDVGYHAYSILRTGRDYSGNSLPLHFQSLAEWRTPLYLYSAVPTVALFGISPLGVRLPAAIFGILGIWFFYLLIKQVTKNEAVSLLAALLLAISPWHIQYSRAGFEVTQLLFFYLGGIYFFLRGLKDGKMLVLSGLFLALTPWVYSTAKLFLPLTLLALVVIWRKELWSLPRRQLFQAAAVFFIVVTPITWSTVFGGGTARFSYISVFTDPTTVPEVGFARLRDAQVRDPNAGVGVQPQFFDRAVHNKFTFWGGVVVRNYLQSFSTNFFFINGDLNLRHSPPNLGQFFKIEALFLLLGVLFFAKARLDKKVKLFFLFWIFFSPLPSAITREGGTHATRLFLLLPPLVLLISFGIYYSARFLKRGFRGIYSLGVAGLYLASLVFYLHNYYVHYPWDSERWFHAGFGEAIQSVKEVEGGYDKVVLSNAGEPPWIFFAGWYQYPPEKWHQGYPFKEKYIEGFDTMTYIDKYHFGQVGKIGIYGLPKVIDEGTLYLAVAREIGANLLKEPERTPPGLDLIKAIPYPSGEPAFYLFVKEKSQ